MQKLKLFSLTILSAALLSSCANNNGAGTNGAAAPDASVAGGGSGDDMYYEYTTTTNSPQGNISMSTKLYLSAGGGARSEMDVDNPAIKKDKSGPMINIATKDKPNQSISLDGDTKTYTVNTLDSGEFSSPYKTESSVSKVGEEKLLGFNCVHARIVSTKAMGSLFKMVDTIDLWRSTEVPVQAAFQKYFDKFESKTGSFMYAAGVADQLKQMGCTGFMVGMDMRSKDMMMHMALTKVQKADFPKSMFEVPAGYTESKN
jgi:hypothetical protein